MVRLTRPAVREKPSDGWILRDEKNYIDWLGCWGIRKWPKEYLHRQALKDYIEIHGKRDDLEPWQISAMDYARELLRQVGIQ